MDIQDNLRILTIAISNLTVGGAIGTAVTTVDVCGSFNINQTTAGQTITIPVPTNSGAGLRVSINNIGTVGFTLLSVTINPGTFIYALWNGTSWTVQTPSIASGSALVGDCKSGLQPGDHGGGWILLNGRLKSTLTTTQQTAATSLGIGANLPDATGRGFAQGTLGAQLGSSTITQANLPNVNLTAASVSAGTPSGTIANSVVAKLFTANSGGFNGGWFQMVDRAGFFQTNPSELAVSSTFTGAALPTHNHTVPLGGSGTAYLPASIGVNQFVFLGV
jgi:hypothetical protein